MPIAARRRRDEPARAQLHLEQASLVGYRCRSWCRPCLVAMSRSLVEMHVLDVEFDGQGRRIHTLRAAPVPAESRVQEQVVRLAEGPGADGVRIAAHVTNRLVRVGEDELAVDEEEHLVRVHVEAVVAELLDGLLTAAVGLGAGLLCALDVVVYIGMDGGVDTRGIVGHPLHHVDLAALGPASLPRAQRIAQHPDGGPRALRDVGELGSHVDTVGRGEGLLGVQARRPDVVVVSARGREVETVFVPAVGALHVVLQLVVAPAVLSRLLVPPGLVKVALGERLEPVAHPQAEGQPLGEVALGSPLRDESGVRCGLRNSGACCACSEPVRGERSATARGGCGRSGDGFGIAAHRSRKGRARRGS
mmetsp:Transcript_14094/g.45163  ORF Transcript_14094/g.45163 Transcript_14094/m.45163 type:complete len:362 (-) Transcript_14094:23-1108(-)